MNCKAPDCIDVARTAGYCAKHYAQTQRHGRLKPETEYQTRGPECSVRGCTALVQAKGLCMRHYMQRRRKRQKGATA